MPFYPEKKDIFELQFEKPNVNFLIEENSETVKIYNIIKKLDFSEFYKRYTTQGGMAYKPEVMLGVITLSVLEGVTSTRAIENKCKRDIHYIYITEYRKPDHSTIARFITKFYKEIRQLLKQVTRLALENNIASFKTIAIDGTKIQSKTSKKHSYKMDGLQAEEKALSRKIKKLINLIIENDKKENRDEKQKKKLESERQRAQKRQEKIKLLKEELARRQQELTTKKGRDGHQINIDEPDARMMWDINANGYNVQAAVDTKTGMIASVSIETDRADNYQFSKQHKKTEAVLGSDTERQYVADGGYVCEDTYDYIEEAGIDAYINDAREKQVVPSVDEFLDMNKKIISEYFRYSGKRNEYTCPNKRKLKEVKQGVYESGSCEGCRLKDLCTPSSGKRRIIRSKFTESKEKMRKKVKDNPEIMNERKSVERTFGQIKWNLKFKRFTRKDIEGATIEITLFALAINIKKVMIFFLNTLSYIIIAAVMMIEYVLKDRKYGRCSIGERLSFAHFN